MPHTDEPQWLLFDVADGVSFQQGLHHQAYVGQIKQAEQRSSWTVRLPMASLQELQNTLCADGRAFSEQLRDWGFRRF